MSASRRQYLKSTLALSGAAVGSRAGGWTEGSFDGLNAATPRTTTTARAQGSAPRLPTQADINEWYTTRRNWGRWGDDDEIGAVNLITAEKRREATSLVRTGRTVSLSRIFAPPQHFVRKNDRGGGAGSFVDYYGFIYHGQTVTHIDALSHIWENFSKSNSDSFVSTTKGQVSDIFFGIIHIFAFYFLWVICFLLI